MGIFRRTANLAGRGNRRALPGRLAVVAALAVGAAAGCDLVPPEKPDRPLHSAVGASDVAGVRSSLYWCERQGDCRLEARNRYGDTPLLTAAVLGDYEIVRLLVRAGADVNVRADGGATPLFRAAEQEHVSVVRLLLENGGHLGSRGWPGGDDSAWARRFPPGRDRWMELLLPSAVTFTLIWTLVLLVRRVDARQWRALANVNVASAAYRTWVADHDRVRRAMIEAEHGVEPAPLPEPDDDRAPVPASLARVAILVGSWVGTLSLAFGLSWGGSPSAALGFGPHGGIAAAIDDWGMPLLVGLSTVLALLAAVGLHRYLRAVDANADYLKELARHLEQEHRRSDGGPRATSPEPASGETRRPPEAVPSVPPASPPDS